MFFTRFESEVYHGSLKMLKLFAHINEPNEPFFKKIAPLLLMGFHSCLTEKLKTHHRGTTKGGHSQKSGMLIAGATKRGWRRAG